MSLPAEVLSALEARFGRVGAARAVGGGCINAAARVEVGGRVVFVKHNAAAPPGMFAYEAEGLRQLAAATAGALRVPEVLAVEQGWLALEWLEPGGRATDFGERLGRGLAALHRAGGGGWGWERDGFIGTLPQPNRGTASWAEFWAARRLEPQLRRAVAAGHRPGGAGEWERLLAGLPSLLAAAEEDGPSLLHGDLWSGNIVSTDSGAPALVDPALYRGHREVDLAMSELFGGLPESFLRSYQQSWPTRPGYAEVRRGVYQLYYLLVHVNLFGGGYPAQTAGVLRAVLAAG